MKIVIAPDSFKGSLTALEVAKSIQAGLQKVDKNIETVLVPMADGGEGTVQSLVDATKGNLIKLSVHDPLYRKINSAYGILGDGNTAVVEMATASGLPLLSAEERNPLKTTTFGTGELIRDALDKGCRNFIIGLGGSATNDGGCGMAQALGARFLDENGKEMNAVGGTLSFIQHVDLSGIDCRIRESTFTAACDVNNPLCGPEGASMVYGPQKGANKDEQKLLDQGLHHLAGLIKKQLDINVLDLPGAGAAGGLGAGVKVFLNAELEKGYDIVSNATGLSRIVKDADMVITGEGRIDYQTAFGKTPGGVALTAKQFNIPVVAIAGSLGENYQTLYEKGFDAILSIINKPMTLADAMINAASLISSAAEDAVRLWLVKKRKVSEQ